jgi:hypothetical protein
LLVAAPKLPAPSIRLRRPKGAVPRTQYQQPGKYGEPRQSAEQLYEWPDKGQTLRCRPIGSILPTNLAGPAKFATIFESEIARKPQLERANVRPMAIHALRKNPPVEDHRISPHYRGLLVTHVTGNSGVSTLKRETRPRVVIKG